MTKLAILYLVTSYSPINFGLVYSNFGIILYISGHIFRIIKVTPQDAFKSKEKKLETS